MNKGLHNYGISLMCPFPDKVWLNEWFIRIEETVCWRKWFIEKTVHEKNGFIEEMGNNSERTPGSGDYGGSF